MGSGASTAVPVRREVEEWDAAKVSEFLAEGKPAGDEAAATAYNRYAAAVREQEAPEEARLKAENEALRARQSTLQKQSRERQREPISKDRRGAVADQHAGIIRHERRERKAEQRSRQRMARGFCRGQGMRNHQETGKQCHAETECSQRLAQRRNHATDRRRT